MRFAGLVRPEVRAEEMGGLAGLARGLPNPLLVVARHVRPAVAARARELGIGFVDTAGNAFLRGPGLYVLVAGQPAPVRPATTGRPPRALTPAGLRVVFVLLQRPQLLAAAFRDIAAAAGVALGTVAAVMADLVERGHLPPEGVADRRLLAPRELAEEWTLLYPVRLRPKLLRGRFEAADPAWWQGAALGGVKAAWGGEVAADRLTGRLRPERQTIYVWGRPDPLVLGHRLRPRERGAIEILEAFWAPGAGEPKEVVPPLLVYADLLATGDPRNVEVAALVRKEYLGGLFGPA
jgi:hypothetical protein